MNKSNLAKLPVWAALVLSVMALGMAAFQAQALEKVAKGRNVQYQVKSEWVEVSEGHVIGIFENTGVGLHDDGEVTVIANKGTFDSVKGNSTASGYMTKTFSDGSTYSVRWQGTTKPEGDYNVSEGSYEYIGGTGRFVGIKGGGNYRGRNHGKMTVVDYEGQQSVQSD